MTTFLKQSTATTVVVGPFVSTTDGFTARTALTISQAKVLLWKQGGTTFGAKNDATSGSHRSNGCYTVPLDATDTNTVGQLILSVDDSSVGLALPVRQNFMVMPANVWDSLFGSDKLQVDAVELNSVVASGVNIERSASVIVPGTTDNTALVGTTTQFETSTSAITTPGGSTAATDHWKGRVIVFTSGALTGQATAITAFSIATGRGRFTYNSLTAAPANGSTFVIV